PLTKPLTRIEKMYQALVLGLKDYVAKNNFKKVILGLSGGIDSALSLAIAVDALGAEHVEAILLPSRFTADISNEDAVAEAEALKVNYQSINIEECYQSFLNTLEKNFTQTRADLTEQNIQARCRAIILMALSNKFGSLVLTTSNKSEIAVGYSTLYGDMAGGFCVLKDVLKTDVYRLAVYRNSISPVIPKRVIERAPSAELAENQRDQDSLPPYEILDEIIKLYVEQDQDDAAIIARGFDVDTVNEVIRKIKLNEYKRRQAPLGVRLNERAFGKDRRYPISSGY
ncbi:MAG TPA: NAD(+) synthase, partial [Coxiellaceae bacterium]|nr:NAD(+) synthase [Coxiellaceae bacterium]